MFKSIKGALLSMLIVLKHLFKKPVTLEYPEKKLVHNENFRGKPVVKGCVKCGTCAKVCPTGAITIQENKFIINLKKCIFCGNCSFYCFKNAIKMSENYELATKNSEELELIYEIGGENERNV